MKVLLIFTSLLTLIVLVNAGRNLRCPRVSNPSNGYVKGKRRTGGSFAFSCRRGYWLHGIRSIQCIDDKGQAAWSTDERPTCVKLSHNMNDCATAPLTEGSLRGTINFYEVNGTVHITGIVTNLPEGAHGFHVHKYGDLSNGCTSAGSHYNPLGRKHGGDPDHKERHIGDLVNIIANASMTAEVDIEDSVISLNGPLSILGRSVVIHAMEDDHGMVDEDDHDEDDHGMVESVRTGNAGARLGCGVIGLAPSSTCTKEE